MLSFEALLNYHLLTSIYCGFATFVTLLVYYKLPLLSSDKISSNSKRVLPANYLAQLAYLCQTYLLVLLACLFGRLFRLLNRQNL